LTFEYSQYLRECFSKHLSTFACCLILFIGIVRILWALRASKLPKTCLAGLAACAILGLAIMGFSLVKPLESVMRLGIPLYQEKPQDALTQTGVITEIRSQTRRQSAYKFTHDGKVVYGAWLTIGGEKFFVMTEGNLIPGDAITFEYLPKSRCVTSIASAESTNGEE
jgi:hypothetical protein